MKINALLMIVVALTQHFAFTREAMARERKMQRLQHKVEKIANRFIRLTPASQMELIHSYLIQSEKTLHRLASLSSQEYQTLSSPKKPGASDFSSTLPVVFGDPKNSGESIDFTENDFATETDKIHSQPDQETMIQQLSRLRSNLLSFQNELSQKTTGPQRSIAAIPHLELKVLGLCYSFLLLGVLCWAVSGWILFFPGIIVGMAFLYIGGILSVIGLLMDIIHAIQGKTNFLNL